MRISALIALLLASVAHAEVLSLVEDNFFKATAGKTVFIKFFAPWCGHCQALAPVWEELAKEWEGHAVGLVAEVDCDVSDVLCSDFQIQGFPTLFYGDPAALETYNGEMDYESLSKFAKEFLDKPVCSVYNTDACSDEQKLVIAELEAKPLTDLEASMEEYQKAEDEEQKGFNEFVEGLQAQYESASAALDASVKVIREKANYNILKALITKKTEVEVQGEVDEKSEL